jgi:hypothetical protein
MQKIFKRMNTTEMERLKESLLDVERYIAPTRSKKPTIHQQLMGIGNFIPPRLPDKDILYNSRISKTRLIVNAINKLEVKPKLFLSASAIGIYESINIHDELFDKLTRDRVIMLSNYERSEISQTDSGTGKQNARAV